MFDKRYKFDKRNEEKFSFFIETAKSETNNGLNFIEMKKKLKRLFGSSIFVLESK